MYGIIYITTNTANGKRYIGQHKCTSDSFDGYLGSGVAFLKALKKYGRNNFVRQTLEVCETFEDMQTAEEKWITYYDARNSDSFYNLANGGMGTKGFVPTEQQRQNMSNARRGKKHSEETKKKIGETHKGKKLSEESKKNISNGRKGVRGKHRPILCIETGKIYDALIDAAKDIEVSSASICDVLKGRTKSCHGKHFKYCDEEESNA